MNLFSSGVNTSFSSQMNANYNEVSALNLLNTARAIKAAAVSFSAGYFDAYGDAFTTSAGRNSTVNAGSTTALYDTTNLRYIPNHTDMASGDATHDPDTFTTPANAFDGNDATAATKSVAAGTLSNWSLGKTFSAKTVAQIRYVVSAVFGAGTRTSNIYLQTYNGASWSTVLTIGSPTTGTTSYTGVYVLNSSVQGVRINFNTSGTGGGGAGDSYNVYTLSYGYPTTSDLVLSIPSGTFATNTSKAILAPLYSAWEAQDAVTYQLANASAQTSGFLTASTAPAWTAYTAFTAEPNSVTIRLTPKSSGTGGYPSILAVAFKAL